MGLILIFLILISGLGVFLYFTRNKEDITLGLIRTGATAIVLTSFGIYIIACLCGASLKYTKPNAEDEYTTVSILSLIHI